MIVFLRVIVSAGNYLSSEDSSANNRCNGYTSCNMGCRIQSQILSL